jgi:dihydropteroate synthase
MPPILYKYNPRSTKNRIILRTFACKYCKNNGRTYRTYHKSQRTTDGPFYTESHGNPERHARLLLCRKETTSDIVNRVEQIITEGADMIDIGAYSSRSNAEHVSTKEEMARLRKGLEAIREVAPEAIVSVDTFRADVASMCVEEYGVALINDISGGQMDERMFDTVARLDVPYIMMHMQGTPQDMQQHIHYDHLRMEIMQYFALKVQDLHSRGVKDIIIDPGFGFGKTLAHNYELFKHLEDFKLFELPLLVGISRKSMIYKLLDSSPEEALNGTTVLNTIALTKGVDILRVHDVKACVEAVRIFNQMNEQK